MLQRPVHGQKKCLECLALVQGSAQQSTVHATLKSIYTCSPNMTERRKRSARENKLCLNKGIGHARQGLQLLSKGAPREIRGPCCILSNETMGCEVTDSCKLMRSEPTLPLAELPEKDVALQRNPKYLPVHVAPAEVACRSKP